MYKDTVKKIDIYFTLLYIKRHCSNGRLIKEMTCKLLCDEGTKL